MLIAHADWSAAANKRWMTVATLENATWTVAAPRLAGPPTTLLARLRDEAGGAPAMLGLDMPIGLPAAFGAAQPEADFPAFLTAAADRFFDVCEHAAEIGPDRPFYPLRGTKGVRRAELIAALGYADAAPLYRRADAPTALRPAAAPMFWTVGAKQVGKAALLGWRELVRPALTDPDAKLWPYDGAACGLLAPGKIVIAETYPAEALRQLGLSLPSKARQSDRAGLAPGLRATIAALPGAPTTALSAALDHGFRAHEGIDDGFDSLLGALAMIHVATGRRTDAAPPGAYVRWEGWILGQDQAPRTVSPARGAAGDSPMSPAASTSQAPSSGEDRRDD